MKGPSYTDGRKDGVGASADPSRPLWLGRVVVHSMFDSLCEGCFEKQWRRKISACRGIRKACTVMNWQTARAFEFKLMQVGGVEIDGFIS